MELIWIECKEQITLLCDTIYQLDKTMGMLLHGISVICSWNQSMPGTASKYFSIAEQITCYFVLGTSTICALFTECDFPLAFIYVWISVHIVHSSENELDAIPFFSSYGVVCM